METSQPNSNLNLDGGDPNGNATPLADEEKPWVNLLQQAYITDVMVCLSLTRALRASKDKVSKLP